MDQAFVPPLPFPLPPERYYFLFRQPIVTSPDDAHDRAKCNDIYLCGPDCPQLLTVLMHALSYMLVKSPGML